MHLLKVMAFMDVAAGEGLHFPEHELDAGEILSDLMAEVNVDAEEHDDVAEALAKACVPDLPAPVAPGAVSEHWTDPDPDMLKDYAARTRGSLMHGEMTDFALANRQFMAGRGDLDLVSWQTAAKERIRWLSVQLAALLADKARLDYLDRCNAALNAHYGTTYSWKLIQSHNVNRLMLGNSYDVDLNDSQPNGLPSCRDAIDERMRQGGRAVA
jgi:hypothetical protein